MYEVYAVTQDGGEAEFIGEYDSWEEAVEAGEESVALSQMMDPYNPEPGYYDYMIEDAETVDVGEPPEDIQAQILAAMQEEWPDCLEADDWECMPCEG